MLPAIRESSTPLQIRAISMGIPLRDIAETLPPVLDGYWKRISLWQNSGDLAIGESSIALMLKLSWILPEPLDLNREKFG